MVVQAQQAKPVIQETQQTIKKPTPQTASSQPITAQPVGEKPSIFKKWWFWMVVGLVIVGLITGLFFI